MLRMKALMKVRMRRVRSTGEGDDHDDAEDEGTDVEDAEQC